MYSIGIEELSQNQFRVWVVTDWKQQAIPASILLNSTLLEGHDNAFLYGAYESSKKASNAVNKIVQRLNLVQKPLISRKKTVSLSIWTALVARMFLKIDIPAWLTQHGWPHVQRVYSHLESICSLFDIEAPDKKILIYAAIFHDLGYMANEALSLNLPEQEIRDSHHEFSVEIINKWQKEGMFEELLDDDELEKVKTICFCHRKKEALPEDESLSFLVLIFRLCDALDATYQRAIYNDQGRHFFDLSKTEFDQERDPKHWNSHRAVLGVKIVSFLMPNGVPFYQFVFIVSNHEKAGVRIDDLQKEVALLEERVPLKVSYTSASSEAEVSGAFY